MSKKISSAIMLFLLAMSTLTLAFSVRSTRSSPATITVPNDYPTIQAAINAANPGDMIYVRNGFYPEHIEVNRTVTLTGESNQNTIIRVHSGVPGGGGLDITASNVTVENFNITSTTAMGSGLIFVDASVNQSSDNVIRNNNLATAVNGSSDTLDIIGGSGNIVEGNQIIVGDSSSDGIGVISANNNTINSNTITGGWMCIGMLLGSCNLVSNNYVTGQTLTGGFSDIGAIEIGYTVGDVVRGNTLLNNSIGLSVDAWNCTVYQNNFVNNAQQVLVESEGQVEFDNGYPSGGNYWSDYNGTDSFNGPNQNVIGKDGIGDTPYLVNGSIVDHYPFLSHLSNPSITITGDINGDGKVSLADLQLLASAFRSQPGDPNWNPSADIASPYGIISLTDLVTVAIHYGQHYP